MKKTLGIAALFASLAAGSASFAKSATKEKRKPNTARAPIGPEVGCQMAEIRDCVFPVIREPAVTPQGLNYNRTYCSEGTTVVTGQALPFCTLPKQN